MSYRSLHYTKSLHCIQKRLHAFRFPFSSKISKGVPGEDINLFAFSPHFERKLWTCEKLLHDIFIYVEKRSFCHVLTVRAVKITITSVFRPI